MQHCLWTSPRRRWLISTSVLASSLITLLYQSKAPKASSGWILCHCSPAFVQFLVLLFYNWYLQVSEMSPWTPSHLLVMLSSCGVQTLVNLNKCCLLYFKRTPTQISKSKANMLNNMGDRLGCYIHGLVENGTYIIREYIENNRIIIQVGRDLQRSTLLLCSKQVLLHQCVQSYVWSLSWVQWSL